MAGVGTSDGNNNNNNDAAPAAVPMNLPRKRGRKPKAGGAMALALAAAARTAAQEDQQYDTNYNNAAADNNIDNNVEMKDVHDNTNEQAGDEYKIKSAFMNRGYIQLPGFGDHKRAVSSVKFASSRLTKRSAVVASSSADGSIKLWDVQEAFFSSSGSGGSGGGSKMKRRNSNECVGNDYTITTDGPTTTSSSGAGARRNSSGGGGGSNEVSSSFVSGNNNAYNNNSNKKNSNNNSNTKPMEPILQCMGHSRGINEIAWNPVAPLLASASDDKTIRLWDVITGDALVEYRGHDNFVFCVDQHQHMLVSGSFDETVKLWDIRSGDCVSTLPAHSDPVTSVSFNRDGTVVCSASHDGLIRLWDVATGECLKTIYATGNPPVCSAKFSPNSHYILGATLLDATLRLWPVHRTGSNQCAKTYKCPEYHTNSKFSIVADFTCHGDIVTGSETGHVLVYDLQTGKAQQPKTLSSPSAVSWSSAAAAAAAAAAPKQQNSSGDAGATLEKDSEKQQTKQQQQQQKAEHAEFMKQFAIPPAHEDAVLAVSAHDRYPLLASGAMTADRKVLFWGPDDKSYTIPKTKHDNNLGRFF